MFKKSCLALATLACVAGAAQAQSSVTIFGIIDQSIRNTNDGTSALTFFPGSLIGAGDTTRMGPATSSRLGFRGTEDLGNGLKANFWIEHRFLPDTGGIEPRDGARASAANAFWNAQSWVGLSSASMGEVRLGRQYVPAFYPAIAADPWAYDYNVAGAASWTRGGNGVTTAYNAATYKTPNIAGFTAEFMVAAGEGDAAIVNPPTTGTPAATQWKGRNVGANLMYSGGPLAAGIGWNDAKQDGTSIKNRYWTAFVAYDLGVVRPMFSMSQGENNNVAGNNAKTKTVLLGATAPVGNGRVKAVVARHDAAAGQTFQSNMATTATAFNDGSNTTKVGLGYEYFFSKRTSVHADVGSAKTENRSRATGVEAGIKHVF